MTSPTRQESLTVLAELCEVSPEARLVQLFAHLGFLGRTKPAGPFGTSTTTSCWPSSTTTGPS